MPQWTRNQLITLNEGSRIHIQAMVRSTVGTMNGSSITARIRFLNLNSWFITSASAESADHLQRRRGERIDKSVLGHLPEHRVVPVGDEVGQSDEHPGLGDRTVLQAEPDAVDERVSHQRRQEQRRRDDHQPTEDALALGPAAQAERRRRGRSARARRRLGVRRRHQADL